MLQKIEIFFAVIRVQPDNRCENRRKSLPARPCDVQMKQK
jgi:hypothetical protein